jgi:hypothetical protein
MVQVVIAMSEAKSNLNGVVRYPVRRSAERAKNVGQLSQDGVS